MQAITLRNQKVLLSSAQLIADWVMAGSTHKGQGTMPPAATRRESRWQRFRPEVSDPVEALSEGCRVERPKRSVCAAMKRL